jgi:hypothetical protein
MRYVRYRIDIDNAKDKRIAISTALLQVSTAAAPVSTARSHCQMSEREIGAAAALILRKTMRLWHQFP